MPAYMPFVCPRSIARVPALIAGLLLCLPSSLCQADSPDPLLVREAAQSEKREDAANRPVVLATTHHGEWVAKRRWASVADQAGLDWRLSSEPITSESLNAIDVLCILMPKKWFSSSECEAVEEFIKAGSALLLVLDEEERTPLEVTAVNKMLSPFGIELLADTPYLHNRGAVAPAGPINAERRELPYSGSRTVRGGTPFSFALDEQGDPTDIAHGVYAQHASGGRIIVLGEGMASLFLGSQTGKRLTGTVPADTDYWGADSEAFNRDLLSWLAGQR
ncbi:MAG: hypothetical protein AAGF31_12660 [Planctomycetota bacterium]